MPGARSSSSQEERVYFGNVDEAIEATRDERASYQESVVLVLYIVGVIFVVIIMLTVGLFVVKLIRKMRNIKKAREHR